MLGGLAVGIGGRLCGCSLSRGGDGVLLSQLPVEPGGDALAFGRSERNGSGSEHVTTGRRCAVLTGQQR